MKKGTHLVREVKFSEGAVSCICGWEDTEPGRTQEATRDAMAAHRRRNGLRGGDTFPNRIGDDAEFIPVWR